MLRDVLTYGFPGGHALKLVRNGVIVTNSSNPLMLTKNIILIIVDCCTPPPLRLAAYCIAAGALITASVMTPNPVTRSSSFMISVKPKGLPRLFIILIAKSKVSLHF